MAEERYQALLERRRREAVEAQVARWRQLEDLSTYAEEISSSLPQMAAQARENADAWLVWVGRHLHEGRARLRNPALPVEVGRDDHSLLTTLGVDFDTWDAWRRSEGTLHRHQPHSESDTAEY